jgi:hypothetical protein
VTFRPINSFTRYLILSGLIRRVVGLKGSFASLQIYLPLYLF